MSTRGRKVALEAGLTALALGAATVALSAVVARRDRRRAAQHPPSPSPALPPEIRRHEIATHDGGRLVALEAGPVSGRPLVLLHGVTLSAHLWDRQLATLSDEFRVIALDWRGHGASTAGDAGYHLSLLAADLATVLDTLDLRDAVLVGHSMGGMALMEFSRLHPDVLYRRAAGLVLVSTAPHLSLPALANPVLAAAGLVADVLPPHVPGDVGYALFRLAFGAEPDPAAVELTRHLSATMAPGAKGRSLATLTALDLRAALPALDLPTLVLVGTRDLLTPEWQARAMADAVPGARLVVFEDAGHLPMLERPVRFDELLREFARAR